MACISPRATLTGTLSECPGAPMKKERVKYNNRVMFALCKEACCSDDNLLPSFMAAVHDISAGDFNEFLEKLRDELPPKSLNEVSTDILYKIYLER